MLDHSGEWDSEGWIVDGGSRQEMFLFVSIKYKVKRAVLEFLEFIPEIPVDRSGEKKPGMWGEGVFDLKEISFCFDGNEGMR